MWELYFGLAIASLGTAACMQKKGSWNAKTKKKYMELKDTDNFRYAYTPKERMQEKPEPLTGPKSKFDSLFEYGRRDNPDIDPEKQKQLQEEIDKIKEEERQEKINRPDNRIGDFGTGYPRPEPQQTNMQTSPFNSFENKTPSFATPGTQDRFSQERTTTNHSSPFGSLQENTPQQSQSTFNNTQKPQGSSFLGSIMDSAMQSREREPQTTGFGAIPEPTKTIWPEPAAAPQKEPEKKKEDKDWVPMDFFSSK
ncbi:MAG: hypothetical protein KAT91_03090 [Candidatus Aenigmarchaeota archaeon]|nr:hypothetical protein [Candidatus Aenigmarchaeota archaeon]